MEAAEPQRPRLQWTWSGRPLRSTPRGRTLDTPRATITVARSHVIRTPNRTMMETVMEIRTDSIAFGRFKDSGPRTLTKDVAFPRTVTRAFAVLTGTTFGFSPNDDHHLGSVDIKVDAAVLGTTVRVTA